MERAHRREHLSQSRCIVQRRLERRTHSHRHHHHHHQSPTPRRNTAAATKSVIIVRPLPLLPWQVNHLRTGKGGSSNNNPHGNTQADSVGQSACLAFSSLIPRKSPDTLRYIPHPTFQRQCRPAPPNTCFQLGPLHPPCFLPPPPPLPPTSLPLPCWRRRRRRRRRREKEEEEEEGTVKKVAERWRVGGGEKETRLAPLQTLVKS